jgi:hypothetical protein
MLDSSMDSAEKISKKLAVVALGGNALLKKQEMR